tara:strand:+ start:759 stop:1517 length:759 start_codon:yes stop_codon:yes gene_type:complete
MSQLKLTADGGGGTVAIKAPASTTGNAALEFKLPVADGSANQLLKTDGSGNLSFATVTVTDTNDFVKLQSATGSDLGSALIFDNLDTATYRSFRLTFALLPNGAADGMYFNAYFRTGGSSGANDTASHYNFSYQTMSHEDNQSTIARHNYAYSGISHTVGGSSSAEGVNGFLDFSLCRSGDSFNTGGGGSFASWLVNIAGNETGAYRGVVGHLSYNNSSTVNHTGINLWTGSGSTAYGGWANYKYTLYGLKG